MNLATNLTEQAARDGSRIAVELDDVAVSYAKLDEASARVAGLLQAKSVAAGDRVGIMLPNVPHFAVAYYGVLRLGAVAVPMNVLLKDREIRHYLGDSGAKVLLAWGDFAGEAQRGAEQAETDCVLVEPGWFDHLLEAAETQPGVVERAPDDTAVILYTSGTTGTPKGAELTHANLARNCEVSADLFGLSESDVIFGGLPLFHAFGQTSCLNAAVRVGARLTLLPRFDPAKALQMIARDRVTIFEGVPTMYSAMLHDPSAETTDTSTVRLCSSGGAAMPIEVLRGVEVRFGCKVLEGYGLSETSPVASFNRPDRERKPGSVGLPLPGVEMRITDRDGNELPVGEVGEIVIRGHNVMKGYWNRPDATAQAIDRDGWFHSGDLGRMDEQGYIFIVDRIKELIIRGGYNVYPREIEEVLYEHPGVAEAAVIGVPHPELGEEVVAVVVLKAGQDVKAEDLRTYVKQRVAAYKYPRIVWLAEELPKGPSGKIAKREIRVPHDVTARI